MGRGRGRERGGSGSAFLRVGLEKLKDWPSVVPIMCSTHIDRQTSNNAEREFRAIWSTHRAKVVVHAQGQSCGADMQQAGIRTNQETTKGKVAGVVSLMEKSYRDHREDKKRRRWTIVAHSVADVGNLRLADHHHVGWLYRRVGDSIVSGGTQGKEGGGHRVVWRSKSERLIGRVRGCKEKKKR